VEFSRPDANPYLIDDLGFIQVPEPATLSMLGIGGLVALRRRRRA
jgi:hypothetical protein